tara:strand:- start:217 stop:1074 length:858 start_codon:yes stop_codon:yes gene_type:complete
MNRSTKEYYDQEAKQYKKMYQPGYEKYPANLIRLKLIIKRLNENKSKRVLDAGCGSAIPMIRLLQKGFDVSGFDFSKQMVDFAKYELELAKYSSDRAFHADLQKKNTMPKKKFDAILALGVFPHIRNEKIALRNIRNCLKKDGRTYIEFRNELFSTFSMNKYSADFFLNELIDLQKFPRDIKREIISFYSKKLSIKPPTKRKDGRISYDEILAKFRNPLTIEDELFMPEKMKVNNIHFYHFHSMPPIFQKKYPKLFINTSKKLEKADSWKGYFLCSAFVVEASKL